MAKTQVHRAYKSPKVSGVHTGRKKGVTLFTKHDHADGPIFAKGRSKKAS